MGFDLLVAIGGFLLLVAAVALVGAITALFILAVPKGEDDESF